MIPVPILMFTDTGAAPAPSEHGDTSKPTTRQRFIDLGLVLLVVFAPLVFAGIHGLLYPTASPPSDANERFLYGLIQQSGFVTLLVYLLGRQGRTLSDIGLTIQWTDLPKAVGLFVAAFVAIGMTASILSRVSLLVRGNQLPFRDPKLIFGGGSLLLMLAYSVAAPIFEETLVRGYLMTELIGLSCPVWLAAVASVMLQGSYHLYYGWQGALTISAGFAVLATYFAISRRLMPVILAHFFWDLTATYMYWHR